MNTNQVINYLKSADSLLMIADRETHRPSEDAVTLCTCQCTQKSAMELLRSFLADKNHTELDEDSLESLFQRCKKAEPGFNEIDISCFSCQKLEDGTVGGYCLDMKKVNECFSKVKEIRVFVLDKLKINAGSLK